MAVTREQVAKLYVANFNRAPDKAGLDYWISDGTDSTTSLTDANEIAKSMQAGAEAESGVSSMTDTEYVISLYSSLFGKTVDATDEGVAYWVEQLEASNVERANMINTLILGAEADTGSADDAAVLANKTEVGLYYADTLELDGTDFSLSSITADTATVTSSKASADELVPPTGDTFTLTASTEPVNGTSLNDVINAESGTLNTGDLIVDTTTTDNDILNITTSTAADMAATPTVRGIEKINVSIDAFAGTTATVDATNIEGATITLGSTKLGYDGAAGVANTGDNNVTAGTNVTTLTVAGLTTGSVDAGSATTVTVDPTAATKDLNLVVNGDITADLGNTTAFNAATITATADSVITLVSGTDITNTTTIAGEGNVTLKIDDASDFYEKTVVNSGTGTLSIYVNEDDDMNVSEMDSTDVTILSGFSTYLRVFTGTTITVDGDLGDAWFTTNSDDDDANESATINVLGSSVGTLTVSDIETLTINVNQDTTIGLLEDSSEDNIGLITGTGNVTATSAANGDAFAIFDASALNGNLTYTTAAGATQTIVGSTGKTKLTTTTTDLTTFTSEGSENIITSNITSGALEVHTGSGTDEITIAGILTNKVVATLGDGDDKVTINGNDLTTSKIHLDASIGDDDTLVLLTSSLIDDVTADSAISGFEVIELGTATGTTTSIAAHLLNGQTLTIEGSDNADSITIKGSDTAQDIDLSNITIDSSKEVESIILNAGSGNDVITGLSGNTEISTTYQINAGDGNDTIIAGTNISTSQITAGNGNDTIDLTGATGINKVVLGDKTSGLDSITGWEAQDMITVNGTGDSHAMNSKFAVEVGAQQNLTNKTAYIISTDGSAEDLTLDGTATIIDWTDTEEIAAYLAERFVPQNSTDEALFIINNTNEGVDKTYIYDYNAADTTMDYTEFVLTCVIDNGGNDLIIGNISTPAVS
jgi:hypothetical protein